ncbi:hypothetical protein TUM17576_52960 [Enterobacter hormaechei]|nr:hypothetical protein TUM17576_52960 [Enterobacter hormaechei]
MTWRVKYAEFLPEERQSIALSDDLCRPLMLCLCRSVNHNIRKFLTQFLHAANMIVMMMGEQDRNWLPVILFEGFQYGGSLAGINDQAATVIFT